MAQTVKGQNGTPPPQKPYRPGQRQQERLRREMRRRRQRMTIAASLLGVVLIILAGVGVWQYPRIIALFQHPQVKKHTNYACSIATASTSLYASTPTTGPTAPPPVSTAPGTLSDGVQCIDLKVGTGPAAQIGSGLSLEYTGWLASDKQKFDSSYDRKAQPFQVLLGHKQVIRGWEEGLLGIKAGGIRRLIIPPALAYGDQGQPRSNPPIPPGATLIFDIVALSVNNCSVATGNNVYNSTPTPNPATPVVGPIIPSTPTAGPATPPPVSTAPNVLIEGLKCLDLKVGSGAPAQAGNTVSLQYTGWLLNGKKFDSSYDHGGQPISVTIGKGQVIQGFDAGLVGLRVGGARRLIIPPALGYGDRGSPPVIPPKATLIFDITVVSIQ